MLFNLMAAAATALPETAAENAGFFETWLSGLNVGGIILLVIGIALVIFEMIIPGFGISGISGAAAIIAGLIVSSKTFGAAMFTLAIVVVILCIAAIIIFKIVFGKRKGISRLTLEDKIESSSTDFADIDPAELIGKEGIALSTLHPSGVAMIDGRRLDVLADGEFIQKGDEVVVQDVHGLRISVSKKRG